MPDCEELRGGLGSGEVEISLMTYIDSDVISLIGANCCHVE